MGGVLSDGYGAFWLDGSNKRAHRIAWELVEGEIFSGLCVLHTCDTPLCVNPKHLSLGTRGDNIRDSKAKGRNQRGDGHYNSKLKAYQISLIRWFRDRGLMYKDIARLYEVHPATIRDACERITWKSI